MPFMVSALKIISLQSTVVVGGSMPSCAMWEPLYMWATMSRKATGDPDISKPTSKPDMPSCFMAPSIVSPSEALTVNVAPIFRAMSRRKSFRSVTMTFFAPAKRAMAVAMVPMRPAPVIRTSSPNKGKASAVWVALPNGSMMAARSSEILLSSFTTLDSGMLRYSANAPSRFTPTLMLFSQMWSLPRRQLRQWPQAKWPSPVTRSPTFMFFTPGPTSATMPTYSWPMVIGVFTVFWLHSSHL